MKAQKWILAKEFTGQPTLENFQIVEYDLSDELKEKEVLFQAVYLSVDPYMRFFPPKVGDVMVGEQLSEVIKTRNGEFPLGTLVLSKAGWQSRYISKGEGTEPISFDIGSSPKSYTLSTLGMPGATAFIGFKRCEPKAGETLLVSGAAGAVGHVVGQLGKIYGLKVIGLAGSEDKCDWLKNELGFDHVFNYKKVNLSEAIHSVAPDGVDIYYDNVGGEMFFNMWDKHMKSFGRILTVGTISFASGAEPKKIQASNFPLVAKNLTVMGMGVYNYKNQWPAAFTEMNQYVLDGRLKTREQVYVGFENMPNAFLGLFKGENIGKAIVKAVNMQTNYP